MDLGWPVPECLSILDFTGTKNGGGGGDNWSCKTCIAAVRMSPPTNHTAVLLAVREKVRTAVWRSVSVWVMMMLNTACDRLLSLFMFVAATVRDLFPSHIKLSMSYKQVSQLYGPHA